MDKTAAVYEDVGQAIIHAAVEVFSTMLEIDIVAGEPTVSKAEHESHSDVVALLGLTGEWSGSGQISIEGAFACLIASRMLMSDYDSVDGDVLDVIAEIANMVVGNVKNMLEEKLGPMGLSTPSIVFGGSFETRVAGSPPRVTVPFVCSEGSLSVRIALTRKNPDGLAQDRYRTPQLALSH